MTEVKVLVDGYDKKFPGTVWNASSTATLVQDKDLNIIVDPGINRKLLLEGLKRVDLKPDDIDYVLITHWHVDHFLLLGIFPKAKFLDGALLYQDDKAINHKGVIPETNLKILFTPGHGVDDCSLIVPTKNGIVAVVGDLFWWQEKEKQNVSSVNALLEHKDRYAKNRKFLQGSRKKILEIADWIIPGHGKIFKNPAKM